MEIERKWAVRGWPQFGLKLRTREMMRQGYLHAEAPVVRIREEKNDNGETSYMLCIKSSGKLMRHEVERSLDERDFRELEEVIALPLIEKERRSYELPDGFTLEVNHVDQGLPGEFWYAEIEYASEAQALSWKPESAALGEYLSRECTMDEGGSMAEYWTVTRLGG